MDDLGRVRVELASARRDGVPFDAAWTAAVASLPAPAAVYGDGLNGGRALTAWALEVTRGEWRAAYEHRPAPRWVTAAGRMAPPS